MTLISYRNYIYLHHPPPREPELDLCQSFDVIVATRSMHCRLFRGVQGRGVKHTCTVKEGEKGVAGLGKTYCVDASKIRHIFWIVLHLSFVKLLPDGTECLSLHNMLSSASASLVLLP